MIENLTHIKVTSKNNSQRTLKALGELSRMPSKLLIQPLNISQQLKRPGSKEPPVFKGRVDFLF